MILMYFFEIGSKDNDKNRRTHLYQLHGPTANDTVSAELSGQRQVLRVSMSAVCRPDRARHFPVGHQMPRLSGRCCTAAQ